MPEFSQQVFQLVHRRAAVDEGGLLNGKDPTEFDPTDPIRLWIIQVGIIICTASLLALGLRKLHQPKVIAEVLGGIILGPTAFGRIPGFTEHVFPDSSRAYLGLVANIGLCLFLFLVGLEIDLGVIKRNARLSTIIALAGMALPFAIGAGLSVQLYKEFGNPAVERSHFMLFTGVAYSITAFPVLCRILTELKLLDTTVGIVVLSAGVGNDIVGWTLLALSVALVNAGSGLTALYILLVCVGWTIIVLFPIKWALRWLARTTGSIENGPTVFFMTVTMLILFGSAFFTDIIGVHAIFGAFLAGLIVPRDGGLAISLTEKLEDMVSIIFLPLYFTLSGLSTDLGLLDNSKVWGYTIAIIVTAFAGKFGGCSVAARYAAGFNWRESTAIGSLMSCKGLVELIVLNVGLQAGILSQRVFSMFVLEALVLTFVTTPLVTFIYPPHARVHVDSSGSKFKRLSEDEAGSEAANPHNSDEGRWRTRYTIVLDKLEHLAGMMVLVQLVKPRPCPPVPRTTVQTQNSTKEKNASHQASSSASSSALRRPFPRPTAPVSVEALRLIELSDRVSAVMKSSASAPFHSAHPSSKPLRSATAGALGTNAYSLLSSDPLLSAFRIFGALNEIRIDPALAVVSWDEGPECVGERAKEYGSDMVLLMWGGMGNQSAGGLFVPPQSLGQPEPPSLVSGRDAHTFPGAHVDVHHNISMSLSAAAKGMVGPQSPQFPVPSTPKTPLPNPFDVLFKSGSGGHGSVPTHTSSTQSQFVRGVFGKARTDVGLFVDLGVLDDVNSGLFDDGGETNGGEERERGTGVIKRRLFLPFFGGPDDRLALDFVVQLCEKEDVCARIVRIWRRDGPDGKRGDLDLNAMTTGSHVTPGYPDTFYGSTDAEVRLQSETADNVLWAKYTGHLRPHTNPSSPASPATSPVSPVSPNPRLVFEEITTAAPLHMALQVAKTPLVRGADSWAINIDRTGDGRMASPASPTDNTDVKDSGMSIEIHVHEATVVDGDESVLDALPPMPPAPGSASPKARNTPPPASNFKSTPPDPLDLPPLPFGQSPVHATGPSGPPLIIVTGRSRRLAVEDHRVELKEIMDEHGALGSEVRKAIGDVASAFVVAGAGSAVLVVQAAGAGREVD